MFYGSELSDVLTTVVTTGVIIALIRLIAKKNEDKRFPPSVPTLPLIISILREGVNALPDILTRYAVKLGPVMSCKIGGSRKAIILNNKKALTEAFLRESETFADRFDFWVEKNISNPDLRGIIFARYDDKFKKYHKICLTVLKEFGFGVSRISETRILHEVESMIEEIVKINGHSFDPKVMTALSTSSVVLNILFCEQFMSVKKNQNQMALQEHSKEFTDNLDTAMVMFPLLRFLPNMRKKLSASCEGNKRLLNVIEEGIEISKANKTESTFVQRFLEIEGPDYNHQDLVYILRDLCLGSLETVSLVLQWGLVDLANHVDIQDRLHREIDDVVPGHRFPSLDDRPRLPYAEAVILELLRRRTVVPLITPQTTCKDTEVLGYFIPKGSMVLANIYSAHMDPMTWKNPKKFDPERFLDKDNNIIGSEKLLPFGLGKRSCPGKIIGRQELFLFLTSLVQRFDIRPPEDQDSIKVTEITAVTMHPSDFKVRLIQRKTI